MNLKASFAKLFFFFVAIAAFQSCHKPALPGTYQNDKIESDQRSDFHALNAQLLQGLKTSKADNLSDIMSKEMIDDHNKYRQVELISNRLKEGEYSILDEFYVVNKEKGPKVIKTSNHGINDYEYKYDAITPEMYIVLLVPKSIPNQWMITAEFSKLDYGWKLTKLDLGQYAINRKPAPELFKLAKEKYAAKCLAVATTIAQQAQKCISPSPANQGVEYSIGKELNDFTDKAIEETNKKYEFPYTVQQVGTQPWIFRVFTKTTPQGVFPQIYYISHIKLADTNAIKKENVNIRKIIGKILPGIDKDTKYVYYAAFKNMPDGSGTFEHFDMIDKLK